MNQEEVFQKIEGFPNYSVSNKGNVRNDRTGRILKPTTDRGGYQMLSLCRGGHSIQKRIHRLVAYAFIPNPDCLPQVNHKDEDKINNCVENLEWMSALDNTNYGSRNERIGEAVSKANTKIIFDGLSIKEISRITGVKRITLYKRVARGLPYEKVFKEYLKLCDDFDAKDTLCCGYYEEPIE